MRDGEYTKSSPDRLIQWICNTWLFELHAEADLNKIPTVLLILGNSNEKLVRMNLQYPLLAFLLAIANVNKRSENVTAVHNIGSEFMNLGKYGYAQRMDRAGYADIITVHVFAAFGAAGVIWQAVDIGRRSVVFRACPTSFYPIVWVSVAAVQHLLAVISIRLSLTVSETRTGASLGKKPATTQSGLASWNLLQEDWEVKLAYTSFARWSKASADLLNNLNFLYGTAIFSSLTLVSGHNAIKIIVTYGAIAVLSRITSVWIIKEVDD